MSDRPNDELIWRYLDGDLGPRERALLEKSLATDPRWQRRLAELRGEDELLRAAALEPALEERARRLAARVGELLRAAGDDENPPRLPAGADSDEDPE